MIEWFYQHAIWFSVAINTMIFVCVGLKEQKLGLFFALLNFLFLLYAYVIAIGILI